VFSPVVGGDEATDDVVVSISVVLPTDDVVGLNGTTVDGTSLVSDADFEVVVDIVVGIGVDYRTVK
jgi:hypothetical protein